MPSLTRHQEVHVLDLGADENVFHPNWLTEVGSFLDEVEAAPGPGALVTTADGKYYTNGLDLEWVLAHPDDASEYVSTVQRIIARLLTFPMTTVAAMPGHAFAAGAMLSLAHDFRVIREDRGYWCLPEVDLGLPFTPGMNAIITSVLPAATAREAMTTARRYGGIDALNDDIVHAAVPESDVLATAIEIASRNVTRSGANLGRIKQRLYAPVLERLLEEVAVGE